MSDKELETIRQKRLKELQKTPSFREQKKDPSNANATLNRIFEGRAWEVFNAARAQFPNEMAKIEQLLVRLALEKKITQLNGEQLYAFLREIGLRVRLDTTITVTGHGKTKLLSEKFKESTK